MHINLSVEIIYTSKQCETINLLLKIHYRSLLKIDVEVQHLQNDIEKYDESQQD